MRECIEKACARAFAERVNVILDEKGYTPISPSPGFRARELSAALMNEKGIYIRFDRLMSLLTAEKLATIAELGAFEQMLGPIWEAQR